jgi:Uma2 family endonuclease
METLLPQKAIFSYEEYIAQEEETREKHDFFFGEIFNMAGTTGIHNLLVLRLGGLLADMLDKKGRKCHVFAENVKLELIKKRNCLGIKHNFLF